MTTTPERDLQGLPKADLHLHLEGSARMSTIVEIAQRHGVLVDQADLRSFVDFSEFEARYRSAMSVIVTPADLARICRELVEDAAAQGVGYIEPMFTPHVYCQAFEWPASEVFNLVWSSLATEGRRRGVGVGIMIGLIRNLDPAVVSSAGNFAVESAGRGVVALGIAGPEDAGSYNEYAKICDEARSAGLRVVPHAGELLGAMSVMSALGLRPDRIAHGVRAVEDPLVLARLAEQAVTCDVCVQSNVALHVVASVSDHPLPALVAAGVPVTLGSDDQLFFGRGILAEYEIARSELMLSDHQIAQIAYTSYRSSGAPTDLVRTAEAAIGDWLQTPAARG